MDGRHNQPRIGRILMARGRDAVDVALTTQFGCASLASFKVITDAVSQSNSVAETRPPRTRRVHPGSGAETLANGNDFGTALVGERTRREGQLCG
jgi:hypothetical protein